MRNSLKKLILLTSKDCHLCNQALKLLNQINLDNFEFVKQDIYSKRLYLDSYWDKIPVLLLEERELTWPFDKHLVESFLKSNIKEI